WASELFLEEIVVISGSSDEKTGMLGVLWGDKVSVSRTG
ncbi:MAG: hypothetical protein H6Q67_1680, partial [Firmicutes bacterium]|nr:hypothetical protein [Bacillota bacterium]